MGSQLHRTGKLPQAEQVFRQILQTAPQNATAWCFLGMICHDTGRFDEAVKCYRRALELKPDFQEVHNNLGNTLFSLGKTDEAVAHLKKALEINPRFAYAHNVLGAVYRKQSNLDKAIHHFQEAVRCVPNYTDAHSNLGAVFLDQGRLAKAAEQFRAALRIDPNYVQALHNLESLSKDGHHQFTDQDIDRMKERLESGQLPLDDASLLSFTLASVYETRREFATSFEYYRQANDKRRQVLASQNMAFQPPRYAQRMDAMIATFTRDYFQRTAGMGVDSELPIFVVGMPRSGTTLVEQIISSHPDVFGAGEREDMKQITQQLPQDMGTAVGYPACMNGVDEQTVRNTAERHLQHLVELGRGAARVIDKTPQNFQLLGLIGTLFPKARIIHCRRDPMDVCLSCYCQNFDTIRFATNLDDIGFYYRHYERMMEHWRQVMRVPIHDVVYEELVADQEVVSREMLQFCGLEWDDRCLNFQQNRRAVQTASKVQVRKPIYKSSVRRWERYAEFLGPLKDALGREDG